MFNIESIKLFAIKSIKLIVGSHPETAKTGQGCFMNVIAYLNGEERITDQSTCVCVTIRPIAIFLNDFADDEQRKRMLPFVMRAMGSATEDRIEINRRILAVVKYAELNARLASKWAAQSASESAQSASMSAQYAAMSAMSAMSAKYAAEYASQSAKAATMSAQYAAECAAEATQSVMSDSLRKSLFSEYAAMSAIKAAMSAGKADESAKYAKSATEYASQSTAMKEAIFQAGIDYLEEVCPPAMECNQDIISRAEKLVQLSESDA